MLNSVSVCFANLVKQSIRRLHTANKRYPYRPTSAYRYLQHCPRYEGILVAGSGSGGTVSGAGKYLKMKNPNVKIVCVEPAESPVISEFQGSTGLHKIQGVGPGFIPTNLDMSVIGEVLTVTSNEAMANARRLAVEEGLLVGISSGAALAASLKVASRVENKGKMIVMVFPSGGERYTNSALFAQVREECINMTF